MSEHGGHAGQVGDDKVVRGAPPGVPTDKHVAEFDGDGPALLVAAEVLQFACKPTPAKWSMRSST